MEFMSRTAQYLGNSFHGSTVTETILVFLLLLILGYCMIRDHGVPPGPIGIPVLGYWPFLSEKNSTLQQLTLKKKYGDVYSFRVAGKLFINLSSTKVLREAHSTKSDCFQRFSDYSIGEVLMPNAIATSNGERWHTCRKFFVNQLKERGLTIYKENTAEVMNETVNALIEDLRQRMDKPVDIIRLLGDKIGDIFLHTLFGFNASVVENEIWQIHLKRRMIPSLFTSTNLLLIGSTAKNLIARFLPNYKAACQIRDDTKNIYLKIIKDHEKTFDSENIRDIIDDFINERNKRDLKGDPTAKHFTDEVLAGNLQQIIADGLSVAAFITLLLKPLLDHPEEQEKIYKELMEVCGKDRNPNFADRNQLTYMNAYMLEAQRTHSFLSYTPSLECIKETTIAGYRIPKGSITIMNTCGIHQDANEHQDPEKFNPLRFISREGKPKEDAPVTFGIGKRSCIGESFVLMQAFLFIAALVKNFKLSYNRPRSDYEIRSSKSAEIYISPRE